MSVRQPPHDLHAEEALIGAVLLSRSVMHDARWAVGAEDFYKPAHQTIWAAMVDLAASGHGIDVVTVLDHLGGATRTELGITGQLLLECQNATPAVSRWAHYCEIVVRCAAGRSLLSLAAEATESVYGGFDPWTTASALTSNLGSLSTHAGTAPKDLLTIDTLADLDDSVMPPWVVEHWLRAGDRTIIVAEEGVGKSVISLEWAMMIAQGVNPLWTEHRFAPSNTLVIDLENPDHVLRARVRDLRRRMVQHPTIDYHEGLSHVWHRRAGIDLRARSTQRELDAVLNELRPSLVVLSPLYKAYRKKAREDHEDVAAELQTVLDDLIARYNFALMIEHHAPKGAAKEREMVPFGSSLWLRWPEYGLALMKDGGKTKLKVGRFRGDRVRNPGWPSSLKWGQVWPWEASFDSAPPWVDPPKDRF